MALFKGKRSSYLGIDIGTSSVKLVELRNDGGRPKLTTYGFVDRPAGILKFDTPQEQAMLSTTIQNLVKQTRTTVDRVITALPSFVVFSSIVSLPVMPKKDLFAAVRWEAKKFVPMPIEEMVLDWRILKEGSAGILSGDNPGKASEKRKGDDERGPKNLRVLLTAAPKSIVKRYIDIFKVAGLKLESLETESFALERSLFGGESGVFMVVDIGAVVTTITIVVNSIPLINRSIDVGGESVTKAIANSLNVDMQRAEQFKRDVGMGIQDGGTGQVPRAVEFVINSIVNEMRYVMNLYRNQAEKPIEKIVLAGGSSFLVNLPEYLATTLNMRVFIGDPWARTMYPLDLKPALDEIGPRFAVAVGLGMREIVTP